MYGKEELKAALYALGIRSEDTLVVHTSLRSVGAIACGENETGADVLLSALRETVADGLLVIPAFTYKNIQETPFYDVRETVPCIGALPRVSVAYANAAHDRGDRTVYRSMNPSHSVVVFGKRAASYATHDRNTIYPLDRAGCYGQLLEEDAKILLIGVDFRRNTFIHVADECFDPTCVSAPFQVTVRDYDGTEWVRDVCGTSDPSYLFDRFELPMAERGLLTKGKLGDADIFLCRARDCFSVVTDCLRAEAENR